MIMVSPMAQGNFISLCQINSGNPQSCQHSSVWCLSRGFKSTEQKKSKKN